MQKAKKPNHSQENFTGEASESYKPVSLDTSKKPTDLRLVRGGIVYYPQEEVYKLQNESHQKGCNSTLDEVEKIIDDWYDTSIKDKNSKVALMITNGGYMNKIDFKEKIKEMRK